MIQRALIPATAAALLAAILIVAPASAGPAKWLHVRVDDDTGSGEHVRVNVPLRLVAAVIPMIDEDSFHGGKIWIDDVSFDKEDLRELMAALDDVEEGDFVVVESRREQVRVRKEGEDLVIRVRERSRHSSSNVNVTVPMTVVDALLAGHGEELDVEAAVLALGESHVGDIVTVVDDETRVRVWIDADATGGDDLDEYEYDDRDRDRRDREWDDRDWDDEGY